MSDNTETTGTADLVGQKLESGAAHAKAALDETTTAAKEVFETGKQRAQKVYASGKEHLSQAAKDLGEAATVKYQDLRGQAAHKAEEYKGRAQEALGTATAKAQNLQGDVEGYVRENPLQAVGIGGQAQQPGAIGAAQAVIEIAKATAEGLEFDVLHLGQQLADDGLHDRARRRLDQPELRAQGADHRRPAAGPQPPERWPRSHTTRHHRPRRQAASKDPPARSPSCCFMRRGRPPRAGPTSCCTSSIPNL